MRAWAVALLLLPLLAGCLDPEPSAAEVPPASDAPATTTVEETATLTRSMLVWYHVCAPDPVSRNGSMLAERVDAKIHPPEGTVAAHIEVSWTPANPSATNFNATLSHGENPPFASTQGGSPLVFELDGPVADSITVGVAPPYCPYTAGSAPDQAFDIRATYTVEAP